MQAERLLQRKEAKQVIKGSWSEWDYRQRQKINDFLKLADSMGQKASALTDSCMESENWKPYWNLENKRKAILEQIRQMKEELDTKLLFAGAIVDIGVKNGLLSPKDIK